MSSKSKRGIGYGKRRIKKKNDHKLLKSLFALGALSASAVASAATCPAPGVTEQFSGDLLTFDANESYCSNIIVGGSTIHTLGFLFPNPDDEFGLAVIAGQDLIGDLFWSISSGPSGTGVEYNFGSMQAGDTLTLLIGGIASSSPSNPNPVWLSFYNPDGNQDTAIESDSNVVPIPAAVWLFGSGLLGLIGLARRKA